MLRKILIAITAILLSTAIALSYQSDISKAQDRVRSGQIIETACGPIEYATMGEGHPVLQSSKGE